MTEWIYEKIDDHVTQALARLPSENDQAVNLKALLQADAERADVLEDAIYGQLTKHWIEYAEGLQLDKLGEILLEARLGRSDTDYRTALLVRAIFNTSSGTPNQIINFLQIVTGTNDIYIVESPPAGIIAYIDQDITDSEIAQLLKFIPAGVGPLIINETPDLTEFGLAECDNATCSTTSAIDSVLGFGEVIPYDFVLSDGDNLLFNDGNILGVTEVDSQPLQVSGGGAFAEFQGE